jgi:adenylate kinase family enzyme
MSEFEMVVESNNETVLIPGISEFDFTYKEDTFKVTYTEEGLPLGELPKYFRRLKISHENLETLKNFVSEALVYEKPGSEQTIKVHHTSKSYWNSRQTSCAQKLENVFIPVTIKQSLIKNIDEFIKSKKRYKEFGRDYKMGILLTGVPGSGKTSLIKAIALKYKRQIYTLSFSKTLTDDMLSDLMQDIKDDSILLIEDIDAFFIDRKSTDISVSFSAIINALDGLSAKGDGLIVFLTANNPDMLDGALIRPGRVDHIIKFDYPRKAEIREAYDKMTSGSADNFEQFYDKIKHTKITMSGIVDFLFRHQHDFLENITELIDNANLYNNIINDKTAKLYC